MKKRRFIRLVYLVLSSPIIWVNPRAGKVKRILCSDWLSERTRWTYLTSLGFSALVPQEKGLIWPYNKSSIDQACFVTMK